VETAVVTAAAAANNVVGDDVGDNDMTWLSMADNGGVDGSGQQHGRRRWLGQRWTTVWLMAKGDNVGQDHGMRHAEWRK
jgi:hypothetical protein